MNKYLIAINEENAFNDLYMVEAQTPEEAALIAAKKLFKDNEIFIDYIKDCCVNMSFAEKFWLETLEEDNHFMNTGGVLIDFDEFKQRVVKYFSSCPQGGQDYITYYDLIINDREEEAEIVFEKFIKNAEDLLSKEYLDFNGCKALDFNQIQKL